MPKITEENELTTIASGDKLAVVDVSDTTQSANGSTKWASIANVTKFTGGGLVDVVKSHGIDNTGATDESADLTTAIAAITDNGDAVYIPEGTYTVTSSVTIPSDARIYGANHKAIIKAHSSNVGGNTQLFLMAGASDVFIQGLRFTGILVAGSEGGSTAAAIVNGTAACSNITIKDCRADQFYQYFWRTSQDGSKYVYITGCYIHDIDREGINAAYADYSVYAFNRFETVGTAGGDWAIYSSTLAEQCLYIGNVINNCYGGIKVRGAGVTGTDMQSVIADNTIITTDDTGIVVVASKNVLVTGNAITPGGSGILLQEAGNQQIIIANNTIDCGGTQSGIVADNTGHVDIKILSNSILNGDPTSASNVGISLASGNDCKIINNTIRDFRVGIRLQGTGITFANCSIEANDIDSGTGSAPAVFGLELSSAAGATDLSFANNTIRGTFRAVQIQSLTGSLTNLGIHGNRVYGIGGQVYFLSHSGATGAVTDTRYHGANAMYDTFNAANVIQKGNWRFNAGTLTEVD